MMKTLSFLVSGACLLFNCKGLVNSKDELFEYRVENVSLQPGHGVDGMWLRPSTSRIDVYELIVLGDERIRYISREAVSRVLKVIRDSGVMKMRNDYSNLDVLDGTKTTVTISIGKKTKEIRLRNTFPAQLKELFQSVNALLTLPSTAQWCEKVREQCRMSPEWMAESIHLRTYLEKHFRQPIDSMIVNTAIENIFDQAEKNVGDLMNDVKITEDEFIARNPFSLFLQLGASVQVMHFKIDDDQRREVIIYVQGKLDQIN